MVSRRIRDAGDIGTDADGRGAGDGGRIGGAAGCSGEVGIAAAGCSGEVGIAAAAAAGKRRQLDAARRYAQRCLGADATGHDMAHVRRVARMARRIAMGEGVDPFLPEVIAYLHDVVDDKLVEDVTAAQGELRVFVHGLGLAATDEDTVLESVAGMSFASTLDGARPRLPLAGRIAQDADWLDAIGAIGIARTFYYGGTQRERIHDPTVPPRENLDRAAYRNLADETVINHFHEKLLRIRDMLNTPTARRIADHRQQVMLDFLDEFSAEWEGDR